MFHGQLVGIYTTAESASPVRRVESVEARAGEGLVGDRYGTLLPGGNPDQEITLIESEALEAALREYQVELAPHEARRNLVTRGVPLNHLVGRTFRVGDVNIRGLRLCEPCGHLEKLTRVGVRKALVHRGGLRAQILRGGTLRVGDVIEPLAE